MNDIDRLIRSVRAWRKHRPDLAPLLNKIEVRLRQQAVRAGGYLACAGAVHRTPH